MLMFILIKYQVFYYHITVQTSLLHYTIRIAGPLLSNSLDSNIKSVTSLKLSRRKLILVLIQLDRGMSGCCNLFCQLKC